jgi:hypothetical protein
VDARPDAFLVRLIGRASGMNLRPFGRLAAATFLLSSIGSATAAHAEPPPTQRQLSAARELFMSAEKDEDTQQWGDALDKLQRVAAVKLTSGVRYHTALCEEHMGHLVAALRDYKAAASQARAEHAADVLRLVDKRVADATDRLPTLTVVLVLDVPDATISVDGEPVTSGVPVPVDPGTHKIDAHAPGRVPTTTTIAVVEHDSASVEVKLELVAPPRAAMAAAATPTPEPESRPSPSAAPRGRTLGFVEAAAALGLAAGGFGAFVVASHEHSDAVDACAQIVSPRTDACDSRRNIVRAWDWVAVGAWTGAVVAGTLATVSFVRLRHETTASTQVLVGPASLVVRGSF